MSSPEHVRMDKWLWSVRLYKTRTLAAKACEGGHVRIEGQPVKSSRAVRVGEIISALTGDVTRTVKVLALLDRRMGASVVRTFLEDLTPPSEFEKRRERNLQPVSLRPKGSGRPTKKERRQWSRFLDTAAESPEG